MLTESEYKKFDKEIEKYIKDNKSIIDRRRLYTALIGGVTLRSLSLMLDGISSSD